jgi:hypothetical protein
MRLVENLVSEAFSKAGWVGGSMMIGVMTTKG